MRAPKIRAGHLAAPRPVPANRTPTGPIRLVIVSERPAVRWRAISTAALGIATTLLFTIGLTVIA